MDELVIVIGNSLTEDDVNLDKIFLVQVWNLKEFVECLYRATRRKKDVFEFYLNRKKIVIHKDGETIKAQLKQIEGHFEVEE